MLRWRVPDEGVVGVWERDGAAAVMLEHDPRHPERRRWTLGIGTPAELPAVLADVAADAPGPPGSLTVEADAYEAVPEQWHLRVRGRWDMMACDRSPGADDPRVTRVRDPDAINAVLDAGYPGSWARPGSPGILCWYGGYDGDRLACVGALSQTVNGGANIRGVATVPSAAGRGLATAVTAALLRHGLEEVSPEVLLGVYSDNVRAIAVYERVGFGRVHRFVSAAPVE